MVDPLGIEPRSVACKATSLPLAYEPMVCLAGFEPATFCAQGRRATSLRYRQLVCYSSIMLLPNVMS